MADVTGPISTLPNSGHKVPEGMKCDKCSSLAVVRVQGETDSFGSEMHDMCQHHYDLHKKHWKETAAERATGTCDWCKQSATDLRPRRDFEEGMSGRVYDVCGACVKEENAALEEELRENEAEWDFGDYDDEPEYKRFPSEKW